MHRYAEIAISLDILIILGTYMRLISGEPETLTNTGKNQTYITGHQDTTENNNTNTTESG